MSYIFRGIELPAHLKESLDAYVKTGRPLGGFLGACVANNLSLAFALADEESAQAFPAIVGYLYNECPVGCWGREDSQRLWIAKKRQDQEKSHAR